LPPLLCDDDDDDQGDDDDGFWTAKRWKERGESKRIRKRESRSLSALV